MPAHVDLRIGFDGRLLSESPFFWTDCPAGERAARWASSTRHRRDTGNSSPGQQTCGSRQSRSQVAFALA